MRGVTVALTMAATVLSACGSSDAVSEEPKPVVFFIGCYIGD